MTVDPTAATAAEPGRPARGPVPGDSLGKYRLERVLGAGGMGIVWAAFDPDLERAVAIKVLRAADSDEVLRSRLLREARAMARLKHPNVLTVYEVGTVQNRDYIAMELVDGDNMDVWLTTRPPREQIIDALLAAGRGLAAAHAAGLIHRDFKPQNVLRSRDGHLYVTDFGLARGQIEEGPEVEQFAVTALPDELATASQYPRRALDSVLDSPLTQTGVLIGTPAYMAPEQFAGRAPDARTDQFAFCVTAWEALTGSRPFRGSTLVELEAAVGSGVPPGAEAPTETVPGSPGGLSSRAREVLVRGLAPSPADRWPDLPSLLGALGHALAPEPPEPVRGSHRAWWIAGALTAVAALAAGAVYAFDVGGARSAMGDDCDSPEHAFDEAWSPAQREAVQKAHASGEMVPAMAILDGVRRHWIDEFRNSCHEEPSAARTEQLTCLRDARAAVARAVHELQSGGSGIELSMVLPLATSLAMCEIGRNGTGAADRPDWLDDRIERNVERAADAQERASDKAETARQHAIESEAEQAEGDGPDGGHPGGGEGFGGFDPKDFDFGKLDIKTGDRDLDRFIRRQIGGHTPTPPVPRRGKRAAPEAPAPPSEPAPPAPPDPDGN